MIIELINITLVFWMEGSIVLCLLLLSTVNEMIISTVIYDDTNSDPEVENAIVFCNFYTHNIGVMFSKISAPVSTGATHALLITIYSVWMWLTDYIWKLVMVTTIDIFESVNQNLENILQILDSLAF